MHYQKIVVKVGTSTLTHANGSSNLERMDQLIRAISELMNAGREVILVSSGAISVGGSRMKRAERPTLLREKQAAAALGQVTLMHLYDKLAAEYGHPVAQILLTAHDLSEPERRDNLHNTFETLLSWGVLPVVNENDSVSPEEIESSQTRLFGDNDTLSARVAALVQADLLVLLTDIPGLYDSDPRKNPAAKLVERVTEITPELRAGTSGAGTSRGTGGMQTKLSAGELAMENGIDMFIAHGENPMTLLDVVYGRKPVGTLFHIPR